MKEMQILLKKSQDLCTGLIVKMNQYDQKEAKLLRRENDLVKKEENFKERLTDLEEREESVKKLESVDKIKSDSKQAVREAKELGEGAAKKNEKELKDIGNKRKFLNEDINRLDKARADLDGDKKALAEGKAKLEKDKKSYKEKIMKQIQKNM